VPERQAAGALAVRCVLNEPGWLVRCGQSLTDDLSLRDGRPRVLRGRP